VIVLEIVYVVAANAFLRTGLLAELINKKPEKTHLSWESAVTYLPGFASVENFELRSQTRKHQIYLHVAEADTRISLIKLMFKTIHIRAVDARDVDFRYRPRLDRPPKPEQEDEEPKESKNTEYWPEIPGFSNPPDPKPEDLYPAKKKKRPWAIKISGADVEGPIRVALQDILIEGDGSAGGGVTVRPKETITIHRGRLDLGTTRVSIGPDVVTSSLAIRADVEIDSFPAKGAKVQDVLGGISGELSIVGEIGDRVAVRHVITPGISTYGAGNLAVNLELKDGVLRKGSEYSLESDNFRVTVMGLDATGSATVRGRTEKTRGEHVTTAHINLGEFTFVDPADDSVDISGTGLELDAVWEGLSIDARVPARRAVLVIPTAHIHDIGAFDVLIPEQSALRLYSGTGEVAARLEVSDQVASGTLDLQAEEILLTTKGQRFIGDLELHARLAEGSLETREFDFSGTTLRLDNLIDEEMSAKQQAKLDAWYCNVELERGKTVLGKPLAVDGVVDLELHDSKPILAALKDLGVGPKWISMVPKIKNIAGTLDLEIDKNVLGVDDLDLAGDGFEALGWLHVVEKQADGRLYVRFKSLAAGVQLEQGKSKVILSKPRRWFDEQTAE
jgi:hypothetical protein